MNKLYHLAILGFCLTLSACATVATEPVTPPAAKSSPEQSVQIVGRVVFNDFEGGFWGIVGHDGKKYKPLNLPKEFMQQGIQVEARLVIQSGMVSFHMWGEIVEIIEIKHRETEP